MLFKRYQQDDFRHDRHKSRALNIIFEFFFNNTNASNILMNVNEMIFSSRTKINYA